MAFQAKRFLEREEEFNIVEALCSARRRRQHLRIQGVLCARRQTKRTSSAGVPIDFQDHYKSTG
jgi:hypothetical protein